jgi:membrane associated rhomboid family serine protease
MAGAFDDRDPPAGLPQVAWPRLTPAVRWILIGLSAIHLAAFALFLASDGLYSGVLDALALDPAAWRAGFPLVPLWQLATYGLLHSAVDLFHLLGNLLLLYFFGTMLEEELGARRFVLCYALSQAAGAALFLTAGWAGLGAGTAVGASGACYGVMIAVATLYPRRIVYLVFVPVLMKWLALLILAVTVFSALVQLKLGGGGTAHLVHLGGIAYGFLAVKTGLIRKDPVEILARRRAVADVERAASDAARVDQLLEKIAREGIGSLSKAEREFLKRASARR